MKKYILASIVIVSLGVGVGFSDAYWGNQWKRDASFTNKVNKLNKNPINNLPVPVLFSVLLNDIRPNFGDLRGGGKRRHEGLDMMAKTGTPVVSPTRAVVRNVGVGASAGNYVYTVNPGEEVFAYFHLNKIAEGLKTGDVLEAGDLIGTVGHSGNAISSAPHLHFEIQVNGKPTNPYNRINKEFTGKEKKTFLEKILDDLSSKEEDRLNRFVNANFKNEIKKIKEENIVLSDEPENGEIEIFEIDFTSKDISCSINYTRLITLGKQGKDVEQVQRCMNSLGFSTGIIDGIYGPNTYEGITEYQRATGLKYIDGIVGPETSTALNKLGSRIKKIKEENIVLSDEPENGEIEIFEIDFDSELLDPLTKEETTQEENINILDKHKEEEKYIKVKTQTLINES
jgi:hypothetical protein